MDATLWLLGVGLFLAWLIGPAIVLVYRCLVVPQRYAEIRDRFLFCNPGEPLMAPSHRTKSGAWHYARLLDPDADPANPEEVLRRQFSQFHGWRCYWLPLTLIVILSGIMLAFSGLWIWNRLHPSSDILGRIPPPFVMALWGAYVWSLYEILGRRKSGDLTPVELYDIAARYVTAIPIGYAFSLLVLDTVPSLAAFAISALPVRDLQQLFRKYSLGKLEEKSQAAAPVAKGYLADTLAGMGNDTIARLAELNIETYLDLAYADPIRLLIKTGVPIEVVLSWIDQAMVSVYAAPHKKALAEYGMPCSLDLCEFYARHCWDVANKVPKPWMNEPAVHSLAAKVGIPAEFLVDQLLRGIFEDPHTQFLIRVWYGPASVETVL